MAAPDTDAALLAVRFCDREYPGATTIVLGGSASTGRRTSTSDIDILLIAPTLRSEDGSTQAEARVAHRDGDRIDVFAYTEEGYRGWAERDFASLRPVLPYLLTEGTVLRGHRVREAPGVVGGSTPAGSTAVRTRPGVTPLRRDRPDRRPL